MAHGGNAACVAALERRAKYITFAAAPTSDDDQIGLSRGEYGPDMRLFCWGGGRISLVGVADVNPSEDGIGECIKVDLTIAGDGFNGVELHPTDSTDEEPVFGDDSGFVNAIGQGFDGFYGAVVRLLAPEQSFEVRNVEDRQRTMTVTTKPGDLELTLYIENGARYTITHLMRMQRRSTLEVRDGALVEHETADPEEIDEDTVRDLWKGIGEDWF